MLAVIALLAAPLPAPGSEPLPWARIQALGDVRYHGLRSAALGRGFHVFVRLPEAYAEDSPNRFPAVYLLDGGAVFPLAAGVVHYLSLGAELPPLILVAVSYGATRFRDGNMRQTDFTAPSAERDFWGGADVFQALLATELIPLIEETYRADPERRVLFGHSLGGQFVLHSALSDPGRFHARIASSPALHRNLPWFLELRASDLDWPSDTLLFVSVGADEEAELREPALEWIAHWRPVRPRPWRLETRSLSGHTHFTVVPEALTQGLKWIFDGAPASPD